MAILKLTLSTPYELALKYKSGLEKSGKFGPQKLFTLSNGDILYLPLDAAKEVESLNLSPLEPFLITKLPNKAWSIERKPYPGPQLVQTDKSNVKPKSKEELLTEFGELLVSGADLPEPKVNGKGECVLRIALHMVIDEVAEAEKYAASKNLSIRFDGADIRAMVNTVCIGLQNAGGR